MIDRERGGLWLILTTNKGRNSLMARGSQGGASVRQH
jgi:hypothetical protein